MIRTLDADPIDWLVERVLEVLARAENVGPFPLLLILRRYCATGRSDLADALGPSLARVSEPGALDNEADQPAWLMLLVEAASTSDDVRLRTAAANLIDALRHRWGRLQLVEPLMSSIDACLVAASAEVLTTDRMGPATLVAEAIDELERVVAAAYRPGEGMSASTRERGPRGRLADHIRPASALITAYAVSGRLPYAMLAEELLQFTSRTLWDDEGGGFFEEPAARIKPFVLNCEAARVLCRLAALHDSREYRHAAVVAPGADYARAAASTMAALEPCYRAHGANGAIYGLALGEWLGRP